MSFIYKHWRGKLPLWVSFWLIGVLPIVLVRLTEPHWLKSVPLDQSWAVPMVLAYAGFLLLLLFPWQAVGVLRSAFNHFEHYGKSHILYVVQAAVVAGGIAAASNGLYTVQRLTARVDQHLFDSQVAEQRTVVQRSATNSSVLMLSGQLNFGVTDDVRDMLENSSGITTVVLESGGGQIYEGRGLALVFREYGLNTHVQTECSSSCTTAFIGGTERTFAATATLGFHQYGLDANRSRQSSSIYNTAAEQIKDAALFAEQGVSLEFTEKMFDAGSGDMWYPSTQMLLDTQVIHAVGEPGA